MVHFTTTTMCGDPASDGKMWSYEALVTATKMSWNAKPMIPIASSMKA